MIELEPIPEISDEELESRLYHLKFYQASEEAPHTLRRIKLQGVTWSPALKTIKHQWRKASTYKLCAHTFGAPAFFKPSLAEVVAQIPETWQGSLITRVALSPFNPFTVEHSFGKIPCPTYGTETVHVATWALWSEEKWREVSDR